MLLDFRFVESQVKKDARSVSYSLIIQFLRTQTIERERVWALDRKYTLRPLRLIVGNPLDALAKKLGVSHLTVACLGPNAPDQCVGFPPPKLQNPESKSSDLSQICHALALAGASCKRRSCATTM